MLVANKVGSAEQCIYSVHAMYSVYIYTVHCPLYIVQSITFSLKEKT